MLNPELLRRRAADAAERLARERQAEEERLRREETARQKEQERLRELEAEKARVQNLAKVGLTKDWGQLIQAAVRGERIETLSAKADVAEAIVVELRQYGLSCSVKRWSKRRERTLKRLSNFLLKLPDNAELAQVKERLASTLEAETISEYKLLDLLNTLSDSTESNGADADLYLRTALLPHLQSSIADETQFGVRVSWESKDLTRTRFSNRWQVPSWLLSTSGSGLLQRIGESLASDAERGLTETRFDVLPLALNPQRWGANVMSKLVHSGQPIGVTPFAGEILVDLLTALGFVARFSSDDSQPSLEVKWA